MYEDFWELQLRLSFSWLLFLNVNTLPTTVNTNRVHNIAGDEVENGSLHTNAYSIPLFSLVSI